MKQDPKLLKKASVFGLVSAELVAYIGGGFLVGHFVDRWLDTEPIFSLFTSLVGLVIAVRRMISWSKRSQSDDSERES